jgi:hypothetical protein
MIGKQNNELMIVMIISLENQKKEMMAPLKNCLNVMNTIPASIEAMKTELHELIISETKDLITELLENCNKENVKLIQGVDDKVTEVLKTVSQRTEEKPKLSQKRKFLEETFAVKV